MIKKFKLGMILFLAAISYNARADEWPRDVEIPVRDLFVPVGFDDNDEVTAVLDGYLPDTCHRLIQPIVSINHFTRQILITPRARIFPGSCPRVAVPFTQEVRIGELRGGNFTVAIKGAPTGQRLTIQKSSTTAPDDYLYAPVDTVRIEYPGGLRWVATLEGRFTNSCLRIKETRVSLTGRTIQLLPIITLGQDDVCAESCHVDETGFKISVELPMLTDEGRYLLHVRSLNGQSVNEVFYRTPHNP